MTCSLNRFYKTTGTTKQGFHVKLNRYMQGEEEMGQLSLIVAQVRKDHPGMSLRDLYRVIQPETIGRDRFEQYFKQMGYGVGIKRSFRRTTDSSGVIRFPNLVEGKKLTGVNQVWVSDITYYRIREKFYYLTFIMDLYSRRIVGHSCSRTLLTSHTTTPALKEALKTRCAKQLPGLILHSDGGGQYYSHEFRSLTEEAKMVNSMGKTVYENPHAERVNGIIKNNYIQYYCPQNFDQLARMNRKAVRMYNTEKPHTALNKLNPVLFESLINKPKKEANKEPIIITFNNLNNKLKVVNTW
jgi:putative transposase